MAPKVTRPVAKLALATFSFVLIVIAFLRGNYLLGFGCGLTYSVIAVGLLWLFARSLMQTEKPSLVRAAVVVALSLPVGVVMAFPASINPDVQHFIDKQATDRAARAELAAVFVSDPAFGGLSIATTHSKVVNITILGSLDERSDLDRLRKRIASECHAVKKCLLHWNIRLGKPGQRLDGLDSELFDAHE